MPESRVKNYDRRLMEAGLRTKKGRGRGSAIMTMKDAAILLIAIASTDKVNDAATTAEHLWNFPLHESADLAPLNKFIRAEDRDLKKFGPAVCTIMNSMAASEPATKLPLSSVDALEDAIIGFETILSSSIPTWARIILHKRKIIEIDYRKRAYSSHLGGLQVKRLVLGSALETVAKRVAGIA
jgi:hypothetical protein